MRSGDVERYSRKTCFSFLFFCAATAVLKKSEEKYVFVGVVLSVLVRERSWALLPVSVSAPGMLLRYFLGKGRLTREEKASKRRSDSTCTAGGTSVRSNLQPEDVDGLMCARLLRRRLQF